MSANAVGLVETLTHEVKRLSDLEDAARALYTAGFWSCDRPVDEMELWTHLRDALGLPSGTSPERARFGGGGERDGARAMTADNEHMDELLVALGMALDGEREANGAVYIDGSDAPDTGSMDRLVGAEERTGAALDAVIAMVRERDAEIAELRSEIATLNALLREMPSERDLEAAYRAAEHEVCQSAVRPCG